MGWRKEQVLIDGVEFRAAIKTIAGKPVRMEVYDATKAKVKPGMSVKIGDEQFTAGKVVSRENGGWLDVKLFVPKRKPKAKANPAAEGASK